ncbi:tetratricopeptide repeat protein [Archangium violaceum]|uniref:tetratricopeptide repeat protein n=1 Tax=Archangium violaceum TaxID=83451 RepID=UPI00195077FE|nr:tetratricopeptide repeat protein [Archangium violaceum]QRN98062.1 tetratricopeptide repeat protein [Archangium violaceum]
MTTSLDNTLRLPLTHGLSVRLWLGGLKLLSTVLLGAGLMGIVPWVSQGQDTYPWPLAPAVTVAGIPVFLVGLLWAGVLLGAWHHWQVKRLERQGWELLRAGRPDAAIRAFTGAAYEGRKSLRARSYHGLTLAWLRQGDYERALSFGEATTRAWGQGTRALREARAPGVMAAILALYGVPDEAQHWVERIRRPMFDKTDYALLAQAVLLCRAGRYVEAVKRIQSATRENVPELDVGAVAVLHAFARGRLGGQLVPLKLGCVLPEKPVRASQYEYLAREWPELAAFLQARDAAAVHCPA